VLVIALHGRTGGAEVVEQEQGQQGAGHAAAGHVQHHRPVDAAAARQLDRTAELGARGKQQVGADGQVRLHAEEKDQDRGHERAAPTPVSPTTRPTVNPATTNANSCMGAIVVSALMNPNDFLVHALCA
jgi:hypothetical protein